MSEVPLYIQLLLMSEVPLYIQLLLMSEVPLYIQRQHAQGQCKPSPWFRV